MRIGYSTRSTLFLGALFAFLLAPLTAQSPNTASMIVVVVDQSGGALKDAKVLVTNADTGAGREAVSGSDGSATIPALSLTGTYTVTVAKASFGNEQVKNISL